MKATIIDEYVGKGTKTVSVSKGDVVEIIQITTEAWTYVKAANGIRGFVPTELLSVKGQQGGLQSSGAGEGVQLKQQSGRAGTFKLQGRMITDYTAETYEAIDVPVGSMLEILQVGTEWTFVKRITGEKGFVPTALIRVEDVPLLDFARDNHIEVIDTDESSYSEGDSSLEDDLNGDDFDGQENIHGKSNNTLPRDPKGTVIPIHVWKALPPAQQHRQRLIYGIIARERQYNRDLWKLNQIARDFIRINDKKQFLSVDETDILFRHVASLYATSNRFLSTLMRRQISAIDGVVDSISDLVGERMREFDFYTVFASKERVEQSTRLFREYGSQYEHPFSKFLHQLPANTRLHHLCAMPREYMFMWPYLIRNLQRTTSKSRQRQEYRQLRKLYDMFSQLCSRLTRAEQDSSESMARRLENYDDIRPHIQGKRLLRESVARVMSSEGTNWGNYIFLFDSCLVFARKHAKPRKGHQYKALKKLKMDRIRVVDIERANLVIRYSADKYFLAFPSKGDAIEWSHLIRHKSYRGKLEVDLFNSEEWDKVAIPKKEKRYAEHLDRIAEMHEHINALLNSETLAIEGNSSWSSEIEATGTKKLRNPKTGSREKRPKQSPNITSNDKGKEEEDEIASPAESSLEQESPVVPVATTAGESETDEVEDSDEYEEEETDDVEEEEEGPPVPPPRSPRQEGTNEADLKFLLARAGHDVTTPVESEQEESEESAVAAVQQTPAPVAADKASHQAPTLSPVTPLGPGEYESTDTNDVSDSSDMSSMDSERPAQISRQLSTRLEKIIDVAMSPRESFAGTPNAQFSSDASEFESEGESWESQEEGSWESEEEEGSWESEEEEGSWESEEEDEGSWEDEEEAVTTSSLVK